MLFVIHIQVFFSAIYLHDLLLMYRQLTSTFLSEEDTVIANDKKLICKLI